MPKIYITYRAVDTSLDEAQQLVSQLSQSFGADNITLSAAKSNANIIRISRLVQEHDALLILIGKRFTSFVDEKGKPLLHNTGDYLYTEIHAVLEKPTMWISSILTD